jgi:hypothetical protein
MDEKLKKQKKRPKIPKGKKKKHFGNFGLVSNLLSRFEKLKKKNNIKGGLDWNPLYALF